MTTQKTRGFTLIELLVVIAIIGILASVVLASLNTARDKGSDAAIKSNLNNARAQAELFYDDAGNTYDDGTDEVCANGSSDDPAGILDFVTEADGDCGNDADNWAAEAELSDGTWYCVGSTGSVIDGGNQSFVTDADPECDGVN